MTYAPKRLCQFVAAIVETTYYTVPASTFTIIKNVVLANNYPSPVSVNLSVVPSGQLAGYENRIVPGVSIPANASISLDLSTVMATGDFISASATIGSVVAITVSGVEQSGNALTTGGTPGVSTSGIQTVTSVTRPATPYLGQSIYESDTGKLLTWSGAAWAREQPTSTLGYAELLADTAALSGITDAGLSVTVTVPAGRRIRISAHALLAGSVSGDGIRMYIMEGGTVLRLADTDVEGSKQEHMGIDVVVSPSAGVHTYKVAYSRWTGTGTCRILANSQYPAFILVEDITGDPSPFVTTSVPVGQLAYTYNFAHGISSASTTWVDMPSGSVNVAVPAGRSLRITGRAHLSSSIASDRSVLAIREGATVLGESYMLHSTVGLGTDVIVTTVISPSAGAHTYTLSFARNVGTGTVAVYSQPNDSFTSILVEDITQTPALASTGPSSTLGYAQVVADQTGITTQVDLTGLAVTVTVSAGRRIRITGQAIQFTRTAGTVTYADFAIYEGATRLTHKTIAVPNTYGGGEVSVVLSPTAGSHTYKLRASTDGTVTLEAQTDEPAYILVEDITAVAVPVTSSVGLWAPANEFPSSPLEGDLFYEQDTDKLWVWDGTAWVQLVASGAWASFTPTLWQGGTVTKTVNYAKYTRVGRMITTIVSLSITGSGSGTAEVHVGLPVTAATPDGLAVGTGTIYNASNFASYPGVVEVITSGTEIRLRDTAAPGISILGAAQFAENFASGDGLAYSATYEAAS